MWSLYVTNAQRHLLTLHSALAGGEVNVLAAKGLTSDADTGSITIHHNSTVFFRVVHAHPSRFHTVKMPVAAHGKLRDSDIAVTIHAVQQAENADAAVVASSPLAFGGAGIMVLRDLPRLPYRSLSALRRWTLGTQKLTVHGANATVIDALQLAQLLRRLLTVNAVPGQIIRLAANPEDMAAATWLEQVQCPDADTIPTPLLTNKEAVVKDIVPAQRKKKNSLLVISGNGALACLAFLAGWFGGDSRGFQR